MKIPFTVEQFFNVFAQYNTAVWPAQIVAYVIGAIMIVLALRKTGYSGRGISACLGLFWIWMGVFYHIWHFSRINPAAFAFGTFFILQGILFFIVGTFMGRLDFRFTSTAHSIIGAIFILYAIVIYPLVGLLLGHAYPAAPLFGVAPCPTTIFTFGILLWSKRRIPLYLLVIPFLWSLLGMSAALNLKVPQDYGLAVAGIVGTLLIVILNRKLGNI